MKRRQRRPLEALGQLALDEAQMALDDDRFDRRNAIIIRNPNRALSSGESSSSPAWAFMSNGARSEWVAQTSMVEPIKALMARNVDDFSADVFCRS